MSGKVNFDYNKIINGEKDHRIGKWCTKLRAVIEDTVRNTDDADELIKLLYNVADSDSASESIVLEDGIGLMYATLDGNKPKVDQTNFIGSKEWNHIPYTLQIQYTKQLLEDAHYALKPDMGLKARTLPDTYFKTRAKIAQLGYIEGEKEYLDFNGGRTPLTTYDGKPLFSKNHKYGAEGAHANGTQSNLFYVKKDNPTAGDFAEWYAQAAINIRQMKDSNGNAQNFAGDTILIPGMVLGGGSRGKNEMLARQAIGSEFFPGGGNNDINTQAGIWNFKILPDWEIKEDQPYEMIIMSQGAKENLMSMFFDRTGLEVTGHYDDNYRLYRWNAYARFSLGHANYRHAVKIKVFKSTDEVDTSKYTEL